LLEFCEIVLFARSTTGKQAFLPVIQEFCSCNAPHNVWGTLLLFFRSRN